MLTIPKRAANRRYSHKVNYEGATKGHKKLHIGQFGLRAEEGGWISGQQREAARKVLSRYVKTLGKVIINIFCHIPMSKKPLESRMGSGKGSIEKYVAVVKKGTIMFEIKLRDLKHHASAKEALRQAIYKLPIRCRVIEVEENVDTNSSNNDLKEGEKSNKE